MRPTSTKKATKNCSKCWRPAAQGHKQCQYHLEYFREYRKKRRQQGLCIHCGQTSNGYQLCDGCASRSSEQMRQRYYQRRAVGLCVACGQSSGGYSLCEECTSRKADARVSVHPK